MNGRVTHVLATEAVRGVPASRRDVVAGETVEAEADEVVGIWATRELAAGEVEVFGARSATDEPLARCLPPAVG